jgi:uncharacterized protein YgbK (DUF1537 family)
MIGVIADDLTGAAELAAISLRYGLRAEVALSSSASSSASASLPFVPADVTQNNLLLSIDIDSRSCAPEEAGTRAAEAANLLMHAGAQWIYKKVDSVLRGQVSAEIEALMKTLSLELALLAPANPLRGRTIREGRYFVRGVPINETEFARDPEYPRTSDKVLDLVTTPNTFPICVRRLDEPLPDSGIVICEAATAADVEQWARRRTERMLVAGGAEFFEALLRHITFHVSRVTSQSEPHHVRSHSHGLELFVSGTTSESSREFVRAEQARGIPVFALPAKLAQGAAFTPAMAMALAQDALAAFSSYACVILHIGLPPVSDARLAKVLSIHLVQAALIVLREANITHVYAEGGATAIELARQMAWTHFGVLEELAPGVATLVTPGPRQIHFTIKPGTYPWPDSIRR